MPKIDPSLIVLKALLQGRHVKLGDLTYQLTDDDELGVWVLKAELGKTGMEPCLCDSDLTLGTFIKCCRALSEEAVFEIAANNALNEMKKLEDARYKRISRDE